MPAEPEAYEWAVLRVVPRVDREEFVNAAVVVYCQARDFLGALVALEPPRALALDPDLDLNAVRKHLEAAVALCSGEPVSAALGDVAGIGRSAGDRFRWLVAPRSTVVQPSAVHTGITTDPQAELARLADLMVRTPAARRY